MPGFPFLTADHLDAFRDSLTWSDNPFVRRDARRDRKRHQPWRSLLWMCGTLLALGAVGVYLLLRLQSIGYANAWFLGDDLGTALCVLISGIHIYYVVGAAQKHTGRMLQEEISRSTLSSLLLLPSTPFQLVLQSLIYPWLVGMRAALALLPLYAVCVAMGGVTWGDILLLYLVFAFSAVAVPRWNRPVLSDAVLISTPTADPLAAGTRGGLNATRTQTRNSGFGQGFSICCFLVFAVLLSNRFNLSMVHEWFGSYMPRSIWSLLPLSFFSWPLLVARGLVTPFDWFGHAVAPLPFVIVIFCLNRYVQIVRVSEWLRVGLYRDLANLPTYLPRRKLESALTFGQLFVWGGYLWRWAIVEGGITGMAGWAGPARAPGLSGFAYALLLIAMIWGVHRAGALAEWLRRSSPSRAVRAVPLLTWPTALRYLLAPFLFAVLFYLACCLLAGAAPFPAGVLTLAGRMCAVGVSGMLLRFGVGYYSRLLVYVGMLIPFAMVIMSSMPTEVAQLGLPPTVKLLTYFSPLMGLVNLGNHRLGFRILQQALHSAHSWQNWVRYSGIPGLALTVSVGLLALLRWFWVGWQAARRAKNSVNIGAAEPDLEEPRFIGAVPERISLDPTRVGREAFMDAPMAQAAKAMRTESPVALGLIAALQRLYDNAVATKEIRARLRGKLQPQAMLRTFCIYFGVTIVMIFVMPQVTIGFGQFLADTLFPASKGMPTQIYAAALSLWYMAFCALAPFVGTSLLTGAFAADYEKSTLGFTLTTPMRPFTIVLGKAIGLLVAGGVNHVYLAVWTLLLSLTFSAQLGLGQTLLVWGQVTGMAALVTVAIGMIALAIASLFPRSITVKTGGVVQALLIYGVIFSPGLLNWLWSEFVKWAGFTSPQLWALTPIALGLLILLGLSVATYGVNRMRSSDVVFSPTRRSS